MNMSHVWIALASGLFGLGFGIMLCYQANVAKRAEAANDEPDDEDEDDEISSDLRISIARDLFKTLLENEIGFNSDPESRAQSAVAHADALIKELKDTNDLKFVEEKEVA